MKPIIKQANKKVFQQFKRAIGIFTVTLLLLTSFLVLNQSAEAQLLCIIEQITNAPDGDSEDPSINADGTFVAFDSNTNINGTNPELNFELYLFNATTGMITQLTDETGALVESIRPSINADGTRIAFDSNADLVGTNPDASREIYLFDTNTSTFTQVTFTAMGDFSLNASINADGTLIAFDSDANINGGNPDGNIEIYLFDTNTMIITQITDEPGAGDNSRGPDISPDGTRIAFSSNANINGGNPDGNNEVYYFDRGTGTFTQVTDGVGVFSGSPSFNADGTLLAFRSNTNINGGNPGGDSRVYLLDTTTGIITQITPGTGSTSPDISADGTRIAFDSRESLVGPNPGNNDEIFIFDITTGTFTQITEEPSGDSDDASINADGTRIAFESDANINGGNPEEEFAQVYLATCLDPETARNIPTLSEWGLIAMAGVLGIIGLWAIRRKRIAA